jgi:beta-N-acetylhexosaminidase
VLSAAGRRAVSGAMAAGAATGALACGSTHNTPPQLASSVTPQTTTPTQPPSAQASVTRVFTPRPRLSASQLAGQRIIYAYAGPNPPPSLLSRIRRGEAAGVIFFAPNIASRSQLRRVVGELQRANAQSPVRAPLLMMTDQEGGQVRRLPGPPEQSENQLGRDENGLVEAQRAGAATAQNLSRAGLNVNLAPVLDVARRAGNFIDEYERSYGANPLVVGDLGQSFIEAQQEAGVAATAKHFPGLGAATRSQNTDEREVVITLPLRQLRGVDELPYEQAIRAGVRLIMLSWATYPALDPTRPAGLSATVIQRELRQRLGFRGVTVTDSLEAGALAQDGRTAQRAVLAASAGADLILASARTVEGSTPNIGIAALHGIASAITSGQISSATAEEAAQRVLALRRNP